ncbi:MAG: lysophospholipid acyltransferase family protein [Gemmatimonadaceae bacterium]|nr:lysophospholipid acyltransferase family protein [Gemmatimonadaceae bacterium]
MSDPNVPRLGSEPPRRGNAFTYWLAVTAMRLSGWRFEGALPNVKKFVLIVAPHTSNWDFPIGIMAMFALQVRGTFLGKDTLFKWPLGILMRWLGGAPVDRSHAHNVVDQTVQLFHDREGIVLALSPEGTRKRTEKWRTGFYWVARGAGVPIVPVAFDFPQKCIRIHPPEYPTGDAEADIIKLRAHFRSEMARYPAQYGP